MTPFRNRLWNPLLWPRLIALQLIRLYQATLSPDHGPLRHLYPYGVCRHEPTCSEYGKNVIGNRGLAIGGVLTLKRILICNPWKEPDAAKVMKILQ
ncbi:membrane protein insertion efficiency factor YidD [Candidatus Peregrinibacteria bacterium]|nr:membrane protein insertion efficiency factor YidD [Candidatus Peregrinibacteria bacterium]